MSLKISSVRRYFSLAGCILLFFQLGYGQLQPYPEIDRAMKMNEQELGKDAVMMIYKSGKIVYQNALGEMTISSQERIASCSKWFTATLVMSFIDEGKISLDDTIGKFLPIFTKYGKGQIKIWHCLSHTAGLEQEPIRLVTLVNRNAKYNSLEEEVNDFAKKKSVVAIPGTEFRYGNVGLNIAARVCEVVSGKGFEQIFQERIARPLNMTASTFTKNGEIPNPSGGAWSTASDYLNFEIMFLNKGIFRGKRIISKASAEKMMEAETNQSMIKYTPGAAKGFDYGFGLWIQEKDANGKTTAVSSPGLFGTWPVIDYCRGYAFIIFTRNLLTEKKADMYLAIKKSVDLYFPSTCK
jgi:CubicO group peptidase (beta-lactamase class C family)